MKNHTDLEKYMELLDNFGAAYETANFIAWNLETGQDKLHTEITLNALSTKVDGYAGFFFAASFEQKTGQFINFSIGE